MHGFEWGEGVQQGWARIRFVLDRDDFPATLCNIQVGRGKGGSEGSVVPQRATR